MLFVKSVTSFWQRRNLFHYLLFPLSLIWLLASYIRKIKTPYQSSLFVICIGNLNIGGSGKTPTAILLGELLKPHHKVVFLTKGYKGSLKEPTWVTLNHNATETGDEPLLLAKVLPTMVAKNLKAGLQAIETSKKATIVIIDDGFQNPTIIKNFNILVVNGNYQFGNKLLVPAGPLRESIKSGLQKTQALVILEKNSSFIHKLAKEYNLSTYVGQYQPIQKYQTYKEVVAFCGIGMPEKFLSTLKNNHIKVETFLTFPDHHKYTKKELQQIIINANNRPIITTEKDYIKIPKEYTPAISSYKIKLNLQNAEVLLLQILTKIKLFKN
ncbi:Tetraacyldisaccharide 4'-kinase [Candidatus Hepatincola sp. Av]